MYPANRRRNLNTAGLDGTRDLAKFDYGEKIKLKKKNPIVPSTNPNSPGVMEKTLDKTRKGGYKGANWLY